MAVQALLVSAGPQARRPAGPQARRPAGQFRTEPATGFLLGVLASLSLGGCADSAAHAATGTDAAVLLDLGRHPPRLRAEVTATVPALEEEATLTTVWQTCGCISANLLAGGARVERDGKVARGAALQVQAVYEPRPASGEVFESIDLEFRTARGTPLLRRVRIRTELVEDLALAQSGEVRADLLLPEQTLGLTIPLRRAVDSAAARIEGAQWLRLCPAEAAAGALALRLEAGPFTVPGTYETTVKLPGRAPCYEPVRIAIRVHAVESFAPGQVVAELPAGATATYPVRLQGPYGTTGSDARCEQSAAHGSAASAAAGSAPFRAELKPSTSAAADGEQLWDLHVDAGNQPGFFEGRCLVRPRPGASYDVPVGYAILVTAAAGGAPNGR
jgi:hypothetical protein